MKYIKEQMELIRRLDPALKSNLEVFLYPSFRVQIYYRIAHFFYLHKFYFISRWISEFAKRRTGIEIHPGATIGKNLFIDHGMGVVIGESCVIKDNVEMYHGVTLGGVSNKKEKRHPTIEDNVIIGANALILGDIIIRKNSKIGAGAIVLSSTKENETVIGIKGKNY